MSLTPKQISNLHHAEMALNRAKACLRSIEDYLAEPLPDHTTHPHDVLNALSGAQDHLVTAKAMTTHTKEIG